MREALADLGPGFGGAGHVEGLAVLAKAEGRVAGLCANIAEELFGATNSRMRLEADRGYQAAASRRSFSA